MTTSHLTDKLMQDGRYVVETRRKTMSSQRVDQMSGCHNTEIGIYLLKKA